MGIAGLILGIIGTVTGVGALAWEMITWKRSGLGPWSPWFLQVCCPALGLSVSVSGEGSALGSITVAPRPSRPMNARTIMAIP